jgi:hypothetical protein
VEEDLQDLQYRYNQLGAELDRINAENDDLSARMVDADHENDRLKQRLDDARYDPRAVDSSEKLAEANKKIQEYESKIFAARKTAETKTVQLAKLYSSSRRYDKAAQEYKHLIQHAEDDSKLRGKLKDHEREYLAEEQKYQYQFECAKALAAADELEQAEGHFKSVLSVEEQLSRSPSCELDFDDLALRLAKVINLLDRTPEAKRIHRERMCSIENDHLSQVSQRKRDNIMRHASEYYLILVKEKAYEDAMFYLKKILAQRTEVTLAAKQEMEKVIWKSIDILDSRDQSKYLLKALFRLCAFPEDAAVSDIELKALSKLGTLLLYRGQPDNSIPPSPAAHDHAHAFTYLQRAWTHRQRLDNSLFLPTGWMYALTCLCLKKHNIAEPVLQELQNYLHTTDIVSTHPSPHHISTLLAHCYLKSGKFALAESTAQPLYTTHKLTNLFSTLPLPLPSPLNPADFHHAPLLITALSKQFQKQKFSDARAIWSKFFAAKSTWDGKDKALLQSFLEAGSVLGSEWTRYARENGKTARSGPEVVAEVGRLKRVMGRYPGGWGRGEFERVK